MSITTRAPFGAELEYMPEEAFRLHPIARAFGQQPDLHGGGGKKGGKGGVAKVIGIAAAVAVPFAAPAISSAIGLSATIGATAGSALTGATLGALSAKVTGGDVTRGAIMGGIGGAISGGLGAYDAAPTADLFTGSAAPVTTEGATNVASNTAITPEMASKLTSADTAQLNQLAAQQGSIVPPNTPVSQMTPAQYAAAGSSRFGAPVGAQDLSTGVGTPPASSLQNAASASKTLSTPSSYYGNLAPDSYFQKGAIQALPAAGLLDDQGQPAPMTPEEESKLKRISPNFRAQMPVQPNPYYNAQYPTFAAGGLAALQGGGPVERMTMANTAMNPQGGLYPQGMIDKTQYATPTQRPTSLEVVESEPSYDARVNPTTGTLMATGGQAKEKKQRADLTPESNLAAYDPFSAALANLNNARNRAYMTAANTTPSAMKTLGGIPTAAGGGLADLGGYSDGGRLLKGPGDGMSDSIPAKIGAKQPARLADGEFVVPADVVSHLGNGSTDAGAKRLYSMMDKVRTARTGKKKQAPAVNTNRMMPA